MKTTRAFKETIQVYLDQMAAEDKAFAEKYANPDKNIDDCVTYILNDVMKSECNGFCDDEIYCKAVHYYVEDNIEVGNPIDHCQIAVNHVVELTEEEKAEARREAIVQYQNECYRKMSERKRPTAKREQTTANQPSLFD